MTSKNTILLIVDVLWWNHRRIQVRCPFCGQYHEHVFEGYGHLDQKRRAPCIPVISESLSFYRIHFPFDEHGNSWYEIDKTK